jgi:hypothetical protein
VGHICRGTYKRQDTERCDQVPRIGANAACMSVHNLRTPLFTFICQNLCNVALAGDIIDTMISSGVPSTSSPNKAFAAAGCLASLALVASLIGVVVGWLKYPRIASERSDLVQSLCGVCALIPLGFALGCLLMVIQPVTGAILIGIWAGLIGIGIPLLVSRI